MENKGIIKYKSGLVQHVGNAVNITNKLLSVDLRTLKIMHLDDHKIFYKEVKLGIMERFPNATIKNIQNGDEALQYVINCLNYKEKLDLIITDMAHPGLNGIDFSNAVRLNEIAFEQKIPIVFITMYDNINFLKKINEIPFVIYLQKCCSVGEINLAIQNLV